MITPKNIGIIGRNAQQLCDGQTIKTRMLISALAEEYPGAAMYIADTYNYKKRFVQLLFDIFRCIQKSDVIFILLSRNGMRIIFPVVNFLNLFFKKPILHDVIGGNSIDLLNKYRSLRWHYKRFEVNWVESAKTVQALREMGIDNAAYLPNFKMITPVSPGELKPYDQSVFTFCTFSRVMPEKGISEAARAVININNRAHELKAALAIYGPVEPGYEDELESLISESKGAVSYMGVADSAESVTILKDYYMLLFPTTFSGEGMPGSLIDALSAGIPTIATDWHYNSEIITHGRTGFLYAVDEPWQLEKLMELSIQRPKKIFSMRKQCVEVAKNYDVNTSMKIIDQKIDDILSVRTQYLVETKRKQ